MAVALEFVNVVVRKAAVECLFPGGLDGFARQDLPNLTEDDYLLRVGYMSGGEALDLASRLEAAGLRHTGSDDASDLAVIWDGAPVPAWLTVGAVGGYWACWASDQPAGELALPEPGFLLRCTRQVYDSLPEIVRRCGADAQPVGSGSEPWVLARVRCVRAGAEVTVEVIGDGDGLSPVAISGWRQLARRACFHADVALIRDLDAALRDAGAEG